MNLFCNPRSIEGLRAVSSSNSQPRSIYGILCWLILVSLLTACADEQPIMSNDGSAISHIQIKINGAAIASRPNMIDTCKGFILTKQQIIDFFINSNRAKINTDDEDFDILPCYASGTAVINNDTYKWKIHSGGIAEFISKSNRFLKICGKDCCVKTAGIC